MSSDIPQVVLMDVRCAWTDYGPIRISGCSGRTTEEVRSFLSAIGVHYERSIIGASAQFCGIHVTELQFIA